METIYATKKQVNDQISISSHFYSLNERIQAYQQLMHEGFKNQKIINERNFSKLQDNLDQKFNALNIKSQSFQNYMKSSIRNLQNSQNQMKCSQNQMKSSIQNLQSSQNQMKNSIQNLQSSQNQMKNFMKDFLLTFQNNMNQRFQRTENKITTLQRRLDNHQQKLETILMQQNQMSRKITQIDSTTKQLRLSAHNKTQIGFLKESLQKLTHKVQELSQQQNGKDISKLIEQSQKANEGKLRSEFKQLNENMMRLQTNLAPRIEENRTTISNIKVEIANLQNSLTEQKNLYHRDDRATRFTVNAMSDKIKTLEAQYQTVRKEYHSIQQDLEILFQPK